MRASFIITNMIFRPAFSSPISQPWASSYCMTQVALPWMPIFSSRPTHFAPSLRIPTEPSSLGRNLGTMNRLMPFTPAGAPSMRASTRWMMLSAMSCSPAEIQIFWPVIL